KVGDVYYVSAPYGQFKFDINGSKKVLFIAGGTGLAPFFSMLRLALNMNVKLDCVILYSVKYPYDIIEKEEMDVLKEKLGLKIIVTVTRPAPGDGWAGDTGHIDANMIKKYAPDFIERASYICGPPAFTKACKDALVGLGIDEHSIKAEMWG
ncbi:MAG: hypothetical protein KGH72_00415, partial [Candidatus Micrarchaeota archaeon]|nr:hypothetical protein [Candidatus Micrarchaeota archaeon]